MSLTAHSFFAFSNIDQESFVSVQFFKGLLHFRIALHTLFSSATTSVKTITPRRQQHVHEIEFRTSGIVHALDHFGASPWTRTMARKGWTRRLAVSPSIWTGAPRGYR